MTRILVVDDDELIVEILTKKLEMAGHEILSAGDGQTALDLAASEQPDLIITDMSLPVKTGWEIIADLKSDKATLEIPIIALSAHVSPGDRDAGHEAGCDAYMGKPIDYTILINTVDKLLKTKDTL